MSWFCECLDYHYRYTVRELLYVSIEMENMCFWNLQTNILWKNGPVIDKEKWLANNNSFSQFWNNNETDGYELASVYIFLFFVRYPRLLIMGI